MTMVFQPDGFYNVPAISSSIKLHRCLYIHCRVCMAVVLIPLGTDEPVQAPLPGCRSQPGPAGPDGRSEVSSLLRSFSLLWGRLPLWGRCTSENCFEAVKQTPMFPVLFVSGRRVMEQKRAPLGCTWSVTGFMQLSLCFHIAG